MTEKLQNITVAFGDGTGPELMNATLKILKAAEAKLKFETIEIGEKLYKKGWHSGIDDVAWNTVKRNKILLKAPITTPQGKGYKSLNVTFRKVLGLFANVRPVTIYPFLQKSDKEMDMVIFRENEEDLYSGIEYRITTDTALSLKLITKEGSEKIIRAAFEYAKKHNRKKITCITKDNIMKISDGIFHNIFREISDEYPEIEADHMIVDIGAAKIAAKPHLFDVIVTLNLYGDIISDIAALVAGSVGLAGSANIGKEYAMFEAIHGSAPDMAGLDIANPSGVLNGAIMMLEHIGHSDTAMLIKKAWVKTLEDGIHTKDLYQEHVSTKLVGTNAFADAVIANLGQSPKMDLGDKIKGGSFDIPPIKSFGHQKEKVGVDIYIQPTQQRNIDDFAKKIKELQKKSRLSLQTISEKGLAIWPNIIYDDFSSDLVRLRFMANKETASQQDINELTSILTEAEIDIAMSMNLSKYDDMAGFTQSQGE